MKKILLLIAIAPFFLSNVYAQQEKVREIVFSETQIANEMRHTSRFRNFFNALQIAGLDDLALTSEQVTIFAPNDKAFAKLPADTVDYLLANPLELRKVLLYHIGYGRLTKQDIREDKQIKTYNGRVILVDRDTEEFILNDIAIRLGTISKHEPNIIVHEINEVLLPSEELPFNDFDRVEYVDLGRYLGTWYQQAAYPAFFNERCKGTKAEYKLLKHNRIRVKNSCQLPNGEEKVAKAYGKIADKISNARLKVSFIPILGYFGIGAGDYQIIHLDEDYTEAIVADKNRDTLFILTRERIIDEEKYQELVQIALDQGFRAEFIFRTPEYKVVETNEATEYNDQDEDDNLGYHYDESEINGDSNDEDLVITPNQEIEQGDDSVLIFK